VAIGGLAADDAVRIANVSSVAVVLAFVSTPKDGFASVISRSKDFAADSDVYVSVVAVLIGDGDGGSDELWRKAERDTSDDLKGDTDKTSAAL